MQTLNQIQIYFKRKGIKKEDGVFTISASQFNYQSSVELISDLLKRFNLDYSKPELIRYHLFICSKHKGKNFKVEIPPQVKPSMLSDKLSFIPALLNIGNQNDNIKYADHFLKITQDDFFSYFEVPMFSMNSNEFLFYLPVYAPRPRSIKYLINSISEAMFELNQSDIQLSDSKNNKFDLSMKYEENEIFKNIIEARMQCSIKLEENDGTSRRMKDFHDSIYALINHISQSHDYFKNFESLRPFFNNCSIISRKDVNIIFGYVRQLKGFHEKLIQTISNIAQKVDYCFPIYKLFKLFTSLMDTYHNLGAIFIDKEINCLLEECVNAVEFKDFPKKEVSKGSTFTEYVNYIFQIVLRYQTLFQNIQNSMFVGHPYYDKIVMFHKYFTAKVKQININALSARNIKYTKQLTHDYLIHYNEFNIHGTKYVASYIVYYSKFAYQTKQKFCFTANLGKQFSDIQRTDQQYLLILLSNAIIFATPRGTTLCLPNIFSVHLHGFHIYKNRSIFYSYYQNEVQYENNNDKFPLFKTDLIMFETENKRNEFMNLYRYRAILMNPSSRALSYPPTESDRKGLFRHSGIIEIKSIKLETIRYVSNISLVCTSDHRLCFFGGLNQRNKLMGLFREIDLNNMKYRFQKPKQISRRYDSLMVTNDTDFYVYGGTSDGIHPLNDLWRFNFDDRTFSSKQMATESLIQPTPSFGYTLTFLDSDTLVLIGGSKEFNIYHYSITENKWTSKLRELNEYVFKSLSGHQSARIDERHIAIIGGQSILEDGSIIYNNAVIIYQPFEETKLIVLRTTGIYPFNRIHHQAIPLNKYLIIVFGGETNKMPTNEDSTKYETCFPTINDEKNLVYLLNLVTGEWSFLYLGIKENRDLQTISNGGVAYCLPPPDQPHATSTIYFYNGQINKTKYLTEVKQMTIHMIKNKNDTIPETYELHRDQLYSHLLSNDNSRDSPIQDYTMKNPYP